MRTIIEKQDALGRLRWFCHTCGAQVQGAGVTSTNVIYGPCSCAGWTHSDNPVLAKAVADLMFEGLGMNP
jgi:hypothetical protein